MNKKLTIKKGTSVTLDSAQFPEYAQETLDREIRAFEPFGEAVKRLNEWETRIPTYDPEIITAALQTYGEEAQTDMMIEEMSELAKALLKLRRVRKHPYKRYYDSVEAKEYAIDNVWEELADVFIMLLQMIECFGVKDVSMRVQDKIYRLGARLKHDAEPEADNE